MLSTSPNDTYWAGTQPGQGKDLGGIHLETTVGIHAGTVVLDINTQDSGKDEGLAMVSNFLNLIDVTHKGNLAISNTGDRKAFLIDQIDMGCEYL